VNNTVRHCATLCH